MNTQTLQHLLTAAVIGLVAFNPFHAHALWHVKQYRTGNQIRIIEVFHLNKALKTKKQLIQSMPAALSESEKPSETLFEEIYFSDDNLTELYLNFYSNEDPSTTFWPGSEMRTLVDQGPSENRIDLTIVGDGY